MFLSSSLVGFLVAASVFAWVYSKVMRRTGNNNQSSIITAGIAAAFAFIFIVTVMIMIDSALEK